MESTSVTIDVVPDDNISAIKVYVKIDPGGNIVAVNSSLFLDDTTDWIEIDEGNGDKYAHAQGSYFDSGIFDDYGISNYKLDVSSSPKYLMRDEQEKQQEMLNLAESEIRAKRNQLLSECDYTQCLDYSATDEERNAWIEYRQLLRDIPDQEGFPTNVIWPNVPSRQKSTDNIIKVIDSLIGDTYE